jgi:hypothetical protein
MEIAMQKREKILLVSTVAAVLLWAGLPTINAIFIDPVTDARDDLKRVNEKEADQTADIKRLKVAGQKFKQTRGRSLPPNSLDAQRLYQVWLDDVAVLSGIEKPIITPGRRVTSRRKSIRGDLYTGVLVSLEGKATLTELSRFLYHFYRSDLAHRVVNLTIDSPKNEGDPKLAISLTAEGLSFASAPKRSTLFPQTKLKQDFSSSSKSEKTIDIENAVGFPEKSGYRIRIGGEYLTVTDLNETSDEKETTEAKEKSKANEKSEVKETQWTVSGGHDATRATRHKAGDVVELARIHPDYASWELDDFKKLIENSPFVKPKPAPRRDRPTRPPTTRPADKPDRVAETRLRGSIVIDDEPQAWLYGKSAEKRLVIRKESKLEVEEFSAVVYDILADHILLKRDGFYWRLDMGDNLRSLQKLEEVDTTAIEDEVKSKDGSPAAPASADESKPDATKPSATDVEIEKTPVAAPTPVVEK